MKELRSGSILVQQHQTAPGVTTTPPVIHGSTPLSQIGVSATQSPAQQQQQLNNNLNREFHLSTSYRAVVLLLVCRLTIQVADKLIIVHSV